MRAKKMPEISLIIVTYNAADTIRECLQSLDAQSFRDFEAIIVDNRSTDATKDILKSWRFNFPVKQIFLEKNSGFSVGNNIGLRNSSGKYIALLNPDAKAGREWLNALKNAMEENPEAGIVTSKILTWDGKAIDSAGDMLLTSLRAFKRGEGEDSKSYDSPCFVFAACAAGAIYRKVMIDAIGFFDEDFFMQCEDTDLSFRAQLAGWKVMYEPSAVVFHRVGHSIGRATDFNVYHTQRNIEFVRMKNVPVLILVLYLPQMLMNMIVDFLYFGIKNRRWTAFIRAKIDAIRGLPKMLAKRRKIMRDLRRVKTSYVRSIITPLFSEENKNLFAIKLRKFLH